MRSRRTAEHIKQGAQAMVANIEKEESKLGRSKSKDSFMAIARKIQSGEGLGAEEMETFIKEAQDKGYTGKAAKSQVTDLVEEMKGLMGQKSTFRSLDKTQVESARQTTLAGKVETMSSDLGNIAKALNELNAKYKG
jgi:hypothetical protein